MNKFVKGSLLTISIIMVAVIVAGCSSRFVAPQREGGPIPPPNSSGSSANRPTNELVQSNTGGSVTIDVEWIQAEDDSLVFNVAMDTHSVELDQYDLGKLAMLRDDTGNEYRPVSWDAAPGGHHRSGRLTFPLPDSVSQGKAKYVEITIRDVAGIEARVLRWEL